MFNFNDMRYDGGQRVKPSTTYALEAILFHSNHPPNYDAIAIPCLLEMGRVHDPILDGHQVAMMAIARVSTHALFPCSYVCSIHYHTLSA